MARGRMVSASLWNSRSMAMAVEQEPAAGLLYVAIVTQADSEGYVEGDREALVLLLGRVGRRLGATEEAVDRWCGVLHRAGLVERGQDEAAGAWVRVVKFHDHNRIRKDREAPSRYSGTTPGGLQDHAGSTPTQVEEEVEVQVEEQAPRARTRVAATVPPELEALLGLARDCGCFEQDAELLVRTALELPHGKRALADVAAKVRGTDRARFPYAAAALRGRSRDLVEQGLDTSTDPHKQETTDENVAERIRREMGVDLSAIGQRGGGAH